MQSKQLSGTLTLIITAAFHGIVAAQEPVTSGKADPFVGTWVIETVNGEEVATTDDGLRELLVLNGTHFFYGQIHAVKKTVAHIKKGGSYRIVDGKYTECIEFRPNNGEVGQSYTFDVSVRDDKLIKSGRLWSRQLDQVWKRFDPETHFVQSTVEWEPIPVAGLAEWSNPGKWWSEENGIIVAESTGGEELPNWHYLLWNGSLSGDFELQLDYRIGATAPQDAGVCFRVARSSGINEKGALAGYQAELDTANLYGKERWIRQGKLFGNIHDGKRMRMFQRGSSVLIDDDGKETATKLATRFVPAKIFRKPPAWNQCRIRVQGDMIQLYLNGVLANEIRDQDAKNKSTGDAIALQFRPNGTYRFEVQNIKRRSLSD